jgi:hypothetical protein
LALVILVTAFGAGIRRRIKVVVKAVDHAPQ